MQTLARSMPNLHKTLILANPRKVNENQYEVDEIAIATEHAPFRHKKIAAAEAFTATSKSVGEQRKRSGPERANKDSSKRLKETEHEHVAESNTC